MDKKRIVNKKIFDLVHKLRDEEKMGTGKIARYLFLEGYTNRVVSESFVRRILRSESIEEYFNIINNREPDINEPKLESTEEDNKESNQILNELRHSNHLIMAMYEEQKNQSRLLQQLIDLWRR